LKKKTREVVRSVMRSRKVVFLVLSAFALAMLAASCGGSKSESGAQPTGGGSPAASASPSTSAAKPIELKYATYISANHYQAALDKQMFQRIEEQTNGMLKFQQFYDGTLIKPEAWYQELIRGTADMAQGNVGSERDRFALQYATAFFNYGITDLKVLLEFTRDVWNNSPELKEEYKEVVPHSRLTAGPAYVHTVKKPIRSAEDFKGLNLRVADETSTELAKALGANPIKMPISEVYSALEKGTIDGVMTGADPLKTFRFAEVTKYSTALPYSTPWIWSKLINKNSYDKLPPEYQRVLTESGAWWEDRLVEELKKQIDAGLQAAKDRGNEIIELSPAERQKIEGVLEQIAKKTAADLDAKGLKGTDLFNRAREIAKKVSGR